MGDFFRSVDIDSVVSGDMPGDKVHITDQHLDKASIIWPELQRQLEPLLAGGGRAVISVHGGSGVGKSETGSLLAHALTASGVGAYVMSGDNYPRRVPSANDAERLRTFRVSGIQGLVAEGGYDDGVRATLSALQQADQDADPAQRAAHPWLATYQQAGRRGLQTYLGTPNEIDFDEVNAILAAFHEGAGTLTLKRMGRTPDQLWYDAVDVSAVRVLVVEWTHGNNDHLRGVDIPILLNSTPAETLAHRRARNRDGGTDSPFTTMVLELEQNLLHSQAHRAKIIVAKNGELLDYDTYLRTMGRHLPGSGPMLNVYPDSLGGRLSGTVGLLTDPAVTGAFESAYLLPSVFDTDLDRGFSVISYDLNEQLVDAADLPALADAGVDLKFDFILNHASVLSPQFQDILAHGERSKYADFFIDWNKFWAGHGELTEGGWIEPRPELIEHMFFRKPGLPILMVRMPDGTEKPYWNTFYQEVRYTAPDPQDLMEAAGLQYGSAAVLAGRLADTLAAGGRPAEADFTGFESARDAVVELLESRRRYLGQMDLNIASPLVWDFYADTLDRLAGYGARIVRLDAFAYAPKAPGEKNFLNDPGTWDLLGQVKQLADARGVQLLPEIHSRYAEGIHQTIADKGFLTYDFFLPGLVLDAFDHQDATVLTRWIREVIEREINTVTMLGCHDGIPVLDLQGLLDDDRIQTLIDTIVARGGYVKDLHGAKNVYYQVNATYFSALGEDEGKMMLARAIQLFTPGKPQVWYLDLFGGRNDHAAVERAGAGGHKEINRTNLSAEQIAEGLASPLVTGQLELLRFRNSCPAFGFDASCTIGDTPAHQLKLTWTRAGHTAVLTADLAAATFQIRATDPDGAETFSWG
ncbi:MAG: sucrose phosphorylase [Propioniciclava sp.]|uniref:sucrose phosphorylase n=1 Tax=Propioniciclava sp. TaxID=2038686 RepID=UPI0039E3E41D